jgi:hypothetical protein
MKKKALSTILFVLLVLIGIQPLNAQDSEVL